MWDIQKLGAKGSGGEEGVAVAATGTQPQIIGLHSGSGKFVKVCFSIGFFLGRLEVKRDSFCYFFAAFR